MNKIILGLGIMSFLSSSAALAGDRLRCRANGPDNREAELRFEDGELRAKWEIDADNGVQFLGDQVRVTISGRQVGFITLDEVEGATLEGDNLIRGRLPVIQNGTRATVGSLSCVFRR